MKTLLITIVRAYQYLLSPWIGNQCRFYPTCSNYCLECLETHGAVRGSWLTLKRLLKCHPFHSGGYDPAPEKPSNSIN